MDSPLPTYLHDHVAGAKLAVDLLDNIRDQHAREPIGSFARQLLVEVEEDRETLRRMIEKAEGGTFHPIKEAAAWVAEKAAQLKLHRDASEGLGTLLSLETLSLGIMGKRALWKALGEVASEYPELSEFDFEALARRSEDQFNRVEEYRLEAARILFPGRNNSEPEIETKSPTITQA